jgi:DNA (cytosine-5)-methyltransferase 1
MIDRKAFIRVACETLSKKRWLSDLQRDELEATISHWCQAINGSNVPFLSTDIENECFTIINGKAQTDTDTFTVKEKSDPYQLKLDFVFEDIPYPPPTEWDFTFIDLFAGIGGFRLAFQASGGKCVFSSEWDKYAKQTYNANFGEVPFGDIRKINKNEIPDHDVLCAGFPCQPFSLAGVSKKQSLGRKHGFEDETQGTLFFEIKEIIRLKRPKAFMLENVKNLLSHDKGKTFEVIRHAFEDSLGYVINWKIVDGGKWVPQHRERIFLVGYDPKQINIAKEEINIPEKPSEDYKYPELKSIIKKTVKDHTLGAGTWATLERHKAHHAQKGNGFGYGIHKLPLNKGTVTRTISARYHKDGAEILIHQDNDRPRRLTVEEAMQLQGYDPDNFIFPVSKTQAYKQIGNSVVVPAISECAAEIAKIVRRRSDS